MWRRVVISLLAAVLAGAVPVPALAQAPSGVEARAIWQAFWERVGAGDLRGAYRYVHSSRLGFPLQRPVDQLQDMARQMQHCRLQPDPLPVGGEDVLFEVHCEHAGEKVALVIGFRQDSDGVWRLSVI
jgi:hypothetical protein